MKVVILAGGKGSRISEESQLRPKPMIEIGDRPILWHIMKLYSHYGFHEFIICCGYKGQMIKEYFTHYGLHGSDCTFFLEDQKTAVHTGSAEPWIVTLANTGLNTLTAGRLLKVRDYIQEDEFMLTYGDGVSDVDLCRLMDFHRSHGKLATITVTRPSGRFGTLKLDGRGTVTAFKEKQRSDQSWINAGFMILNSRMFDYLGDGSRMLEDGVLDYVAAEGEMAAYKHDGFWSPMDTLRDKEYLEGLWNTGKAPWKVWE